MKYMLLIHNSEQALNALSEGELKQMMADFRRFSEEIRTSGHYRAGSQLQPTSNQNSLNCLLACSGLDRNFE